MTSDTRRRILDTARELWNREGLHGAGVRDIARAIGMSPGNLSYHFATKDDLVHALVLELHEINAVSVFAELPVDFSIPGLYAAAVAVMRNILRYRFVVESYAEAARGSDTIQKLEAKLRDKRLARYDAMIARLAERGLVDGRAIAARSVWLYEQVEMISSGWLSASAFRPDLKTDRAIVLHYAKVGCALLAPHCTKKGEREMESVLAGDHDAKVWPRR